ncbi:MAG: HD domain-containing protein [Weeksellaceae bacterium]|nr:HD domain-containing protein [Weeksellaceae bacterium]
MNVQDFFLEVEQIVANYLAHDTTGHDLQHIRRVVALSKIIAQKEQADVEYCTLIAWLHDIGDYKLNHGQDKSAEHIAHVLQQYPTLTYSLEQIIEDVQKIGFKGGFNTEEVSLEVKIVRDADRLDAIGAIGVARAFAYGGSKNRAMYTPNENADAPKSAEEYMQRNTSTIQHFYDKLLHLRDGLYTQTAREIATERHRFLEDFLEQFYKEWNYSEL